MHLVAQDVLHMYARYICNNVFLSCKIIQDGAERIEKNEVEVQKVRFFILDNCSIYKIFFLGIYFFVLFSNICMHVTYVTVHFLVASCWTCHATYISIWKTVDAKNEVGMRKVRFFTI